MGVSRKRAWERADTLLSSRGTRSVPVVLRRGKGGVTLLHGGRAITHCHNTKNGRLAAGLVAEALGVEVPAIGASVEATVSTGVLYRAVSISSIDLRIPEARPLVRRLLEEAVEQRLSASPETD